MSAKDAMDFIRKQEKDVAPTQRTSPRAYPQAPCPDMAERRYWPRDKIARHWDIRASGNFGSSPTVGIKRYRIAAEHHLD
jgi:hypothetical protein